MSGADAQCGAARRLLRARRDRGCLLALLLVQAVLLLAGPAPHWAFAAGTLLALVSVALASARVRGARLALAVAPAGPTLNRGWIRAFELEVWGEVFHCFGHRYLVELREGTCPLCGRPGEPAPAGPPGSDGLAVHARYQGRAALATAARVNASPREACRLIREALHAIEGSTERDDLDLADELIEAYGKWELAARRPPVTQAADELVAALGRARVLESRGHVTLAEAVAAHAAIIGARRRLLVRRSEWERAGYAPEILTATAATSAARWARWIRAAGPGVIEAPAFGDPPGCSPFVLTRRDPEAVAVSLPLAGSASRARVAMPSGGEVLADLETGRVILPVSEDLVPRAELRQLPLAPYPLRSVPPWAGPTN